LKTLRIGLLWHSAAAGNLGVGALSVGNIALVRAAAERIGVKPHFTLFGGREPDKPYITGDDIELRVIDGRYMASPLGYLADIKSQDIVLDIGAGDSFADIYTDKRFAYMMATKIVPIMAGKPLIMSPQTIGPFTRQPHTRMAAWVCRKAAVVFARDPLSMDVLKKLAPTADARQVIDVAFVLPFERPVRDPTDTKIHVGLNVSGLLMSGGYAANNDYGLGFDYPAMTRALIAAFTAMPGVTLSLVPHVNAPGMPRDDDGAACDMLKREFPQVERVPTFASPSAAKSYIAGLDFLVGARMHATIAAYSAGVPVVPVSYSRKFEGLFGGLRYPWVVNAKGMDTDAAVAFVLDAFSRRTEMARDLTAGMGVVKAGLEDYTAELAKQLAACA
jgi:polysaccharide pyruvyl transferase WcaK-like protein